MHFPFVAPDLDDATERTTLVAHVAHPSKEAEFVAYGAVIVS